MQTLDGVEVLTIREAAAHVGRTPETLRRWVWSGRVSALRSGNRLLIPRSQLDDAVTPRAEGISLRDWAAAAPRRSGGTQASAASLVLDDRTDDHRR